MVIHVSAIALSWIAVKNGNPDLVAIWLLQETQTKYQVLHSLKTSHLPCFGSFKIWRLWDVGF